MTNDSSSYKWSAQSSIPQSTRTKRQSSVPVEPTNYSPIQQQQQQQQRQRQPLPITSNSASLKPLSVTTTTLHSSSLNTKSEPNTALAGPSRYTLHGGNDDDVDEGDDHRVRAYTNGRGNIKSQDHYRGDVGGIHPLQLEIDRLSAACQDHELKIRSSKATIEHRLFAEFPNMLSRLDEVDEAAEQITARLYSSLNTILPPLKSQLKFTLQDREKDFETIKERTTPWRRLGYDRDHDYNLDVSGNRAEGDRDSMGNGNGNGSGNRDRSSRSSRSIAGNGIIPRVAGLGEAGQIDGIGTMEKWAEEVTLFLDSEKIRIEERLQSLSWRRSLITRLMMLCFILLGFILFYIWARGGFSVCWIWRGGGWVRKRKRIIGEL